MIQAGLMGAPFPHQRLLSGAACLPGLSGGAMLPHEVLLAGRVHVDLDAMGMGSGLGFPPIDQIKSAGKAIGKGAKAVGDVAVKGIKAGVNVVKEAANLAGQGLLKVGQITVKLGGKILDLALLPFNAMLKICLKIGDLMCALPPQTLAMVGAAAGASMGAPVPPQQVMALRESFCSTLQTVKSSGFKNIKDVVKLSKMIPIALKIVTEIPKVTQQMQMQAQSQGAAQQLQQQGASPPEAAAVEQVVGAAEIDGLLDATAQQLNQLPRDLTSAKKSGQQAVKNVFKALGRQGVAQMTTFMQEKAAGLAQDATEAFTSLRPAQIAALKRRIGWLKKAGRTGDALKLEARLSISGGFSGASSASTGHRAAIGVTAGTALAATGLGLFFAFR